MTQRNAGEPGDRTSDSCHTDMCTSPPGLGGFGDIQFVYMDAPGSDAAGVWKPIVLGDAGLCK